MNIPHWERPIILIVDDNPNNLEVLSETLAGNGLQVAIATDGDSAIDQIQYHKPDLILLDVMMPGISGFETCRILKNNPQTADIPVIFMTALADVANKVMGLSIGAVDYITKPFQYEEVVARVRVHLELRFLNRQVLEQTVELQRINLELLKLNQELQRLVNLDGLTGVANRRRFDEYLSQEWKRLMHQGRNFSLILCDIDYFKLYNDFYGHQAGDSCLQKVAETISNSLQNPVYLVARYGGEEFAIVLPDVPAKEAVEIAEEIRLKIYHLQIPHQQSKIGCWVTLSLGISSQSYHGETKSSHPLLSTADKALYMAKVKGRNTLCYLPVSPEPQLITEMQR